MGEKFYFFKLVYYDECSGEVISTTYSFTPLPEGGEARKLKEMLGDCKIHYENGEYIIYFKNEDDFKEADKKLIEYVLNFLSGIQ